MTQRTNRRFKDAIYAQFARIGKAVAAPKRLELIDVLCQGPRTVESLAAQIGVSIANVSQHLQILRAARLVDAEKAYDRCDWHAVSRGDEGQQLSLLRPHSQVRQQGVNVKAGLAIGLVNR